MGAHNEIKEDLSEWVVEKILKAYSLKNFLIFFSPLPGKGGERKKLAPPQRGAPGRAGGKKSSWTQSMKIFLKLFPHPTGEEKVS